MDGVESSIADQAAQAYNIYLITYVGVGTTETDARGHKKTPRKTLDFIPFWK